MQVSQSFNEVIDEACDAGCNGGRVVPTGGPTDPLLSADTGNAPITYTDAVNCTFTDTLCRGDLDPAGSTLTYTPAGCNCPSPPCGCQVTLTTVIRPCLAGIRNRALYSDTTTALGKRVHCAAAGIATVISKDGFWGWH
jgi:hypothetical protein